MKRKLLTLLLCAISYCSFAQSLTGETSPCPNVDYTYQITLSTQKQPPLVTTLTNGHITSQSTSQTLNDVTYKYVIRWDNFYQVQNGSPVKSTFNVLTGTIGSNPTENYPISVTIRGVGGITVPTPPAPSCAFRGNLVVPVNGVANATRYVWSNNAGWGGNGTTSSPSNTFIVNNESAATLTVTAYNDACSASNPIPQSSTLINITRPAVTSLPVFTATSPKELCIGNTATAGVTVTEGTPISYEWYTLPANIIAINGGNYNSTTAPLTTTTPNVTLSYVGPSYGAPTTTLYCRAVYSSSCKSDYAYYGINAGKPYVSTFSATTISLGAVTGDSYAACPNEVLQIWPTVNFGNASILEHQWEVVSGTYSSISNLTGVPLRLRMSSRLNSEVEFRYRYRTSCGWSDWLLCYAFVWDCSGATQRTAVITEKTAPDAIAPVSITLAPNPASNEIAVNMPETKSKADLFVNISDIKGTSLIRRKQSATSRFTVDISALPAGQYILQVQSGEQRYSKMFIVAK